MPTLSVILPVFNAEKYLREAIESILNQTYTDFELVIINDGSTDSSDEIIESYNDERIISIRNEVNKGLIFSLNRAIDLANGAFIARMDADDIALPNRFEQQLLHFDGANPAILATTVKLIDEAGNLLPDWHDDIQNIHPQKIKKFLLTDNCIAHPTVLGRSEIFKKYRYQENQKFSEDYDLWLRIVADGLIIEKLNSPLLLHRILPTSATRFKKVNVFYRLSKVKFRFLWQQIKKWHITIYHLKIVVFAIVDLAKAFGKEIKKLFKS